MHPEHRPQPMPLVQPFPRPGHALINAYRELTHAENGTAEQRRALGNIDKLARPWIPATCTDPQLRAELWNWLDAVVVWLNHEYVFDPANVIPACWPQHAHLVHEVAVLADRRRRAELALDSEPLEEWNRYSLPAFLNRMRHRVGDHCTSEHPAIWPSAGRFNRHLDDGAAQARQRAFASDLTATGQTSSTAPTVPAGPHLRVVDETTGELFD